MISFVGVGSGDIDKGQRRLQEADAVICGRLTEELEAVNRRAFL